MRARLVYLVPKICHVALILRESQWLPLRQRIVFGRILITFKILNNLAPSYLSSLISVATLSRYSLCSCCDGTLLRFPPMKSSKTLGNCAFMFAAPKLLNNLLHNIRTTTSLSCFEIKLNKIYFPTFFMTNFVHMEIALREYYYYYCSNR